MAAQPLSEELKQQARDAFKQHGTIAGAARALGLPRGTYQSRLEAARLDGPPCHESPEPAPLPPPDLPFEDRLDQIKARNSLRIAHKRAQAWQRVTIPIHGPYGLCFFGDPHLDDPYCDLGLIEEHAGICRETPGLFGVNGGDSLNNWIGNLKKLYADQPVTADEGWELADWFMNGLGVRWALWLLGNHDVWETGFRIFERMNVQRILMRDWDAKVVLNSPDGDCRLWARHDFKGSSIYNELHGLRRAATFSANADIYAAFHRHTWGTASGEGEDGKRFCLVRARGYKMCDDYAVKNGFTEQRVGQSVVTVVQPRRGQDALVYAFDDVATGADFLTFLRRKEAA